MRKVTQNLLISIGIFILSLVLITSPVFLVLGVDAGMKYVEEFFEEIWEDGEVDTVEGHGAIFIGALGFLGLLGEIMIIMILFFMGLHISSCLFLAIIARFFYAPRKGWRLVVYRILMTLVYILQVGTVVFSFTLIGIEGFVSKLIFIPIALLMIAGTIYSAINTYSERILK